MRRGDITRHVMSVIATSERPLTQGDIRDELLERDVVMWEPAIHGVLKNKHKNGSLTRYKVTNERQGAKGKQSWGYCIK